MDRDFEERLPEGTYEKVRAIAERRYRKRPVTIEAVHWTGDNGEEVARFMGQDRPPWPGPTPIEIQTLEGTMTARVGDWIIRGIKGEYYLCKPDIFEATYEPATVEGA